MMNCYELLLLLLYDELIRLLLLLLYDELL